VPVLQHFTRKRDDTALKKRALKIALLDTLPVLTALFVSLFVEQWLSSKNHLSALIGIISTVVCLLIFGNGKQTPDIIVYLGKVLPYAIMGMLVVYCMKDISFLKAPYGIPELLGCGFVAAAHVWKRNSLLSIGAGTVFYMLLVQLVF